MSAPERSVVRSALGLLQVRTVLAQTTLVAVVAALSVLWLHVPDASAMDVVASVLLGLLVMWVAGAGEAALFLRLCNTPRTKRRLLIGAVLLLIGTGLWLLACSWISQMERGDYLRAGYLNSRVSFRWRNVFSFAHISMWLRWMWTAIKWMGAGLIAAFAFPAIASARPIAAIWRVMRSITYWVVMLAAAIAASALTGTLMSWTPGHGLRAETISLVLRLGVAVLLDSTAVVFTLSVLAACVSTPDDVSAGR